MTLGMNAKTKTLGNRRYRQAFPAQADQPTPRSDDATLLNRGQVSKAMTITPSPSQEALINVAIQAGLIRSAQDALDLALRQLLDRIPGQPESDVAASSVADKMAAPPESWAESVSLWVHQGVAEPGADLARTLEEIREERIASNLGMNP